MEVAGEMWKIKAEPVEVKVDIPNYKRVRIAEEDEGISIKLIIDGWTYVLQP